MQDMASGSTIADDDDDDSATLLLIVETRPVAWKLVRAKNPSVDVDAICSQVREGGREASIGGCACCQENDDDDDDDVRLLWFPIYAQLQAFVNAFLSLHHRNRLICLAEHSDAW